MEDKVRISFRKFDVKYVNKKWKLNSFFILSGKLNIVLHADLIQARQIVPS